MRVAFELPSVIEITLGECKHDGNVAEIDPLAVGHVMYYECLDCGDKFPVIGDTDKWPPGVRVTNLRIKRL